jgi:hypothetical protein
MRRYIGIVIALVTVAAVFQAESVKAAAAKRSSQSKSGMAVAYAKANIGTGTILSFGGKGTTAAEVTAANLSQDIWITFTGKYPKDITTNQVILNATAQAHDYGVANARVYTANPTQIEVAVSGWISDNTSSSSGETVFLAVFLGY